MSHTSKNTPTERRLDPSDRLVNLFAALAQGVTDRVKGVIFEAFPSGGETAAALVVIGHQPGMSIDQVSKILRLSHAGAVRLVDRLISQGLVAKTPSAADRRMMHLDLTVEGSEERRKLLALRNASVAELLGGLAVEERKLLERLSESILARLPCDALSALTTCRFCDEKTCTACPMEAFGRVATF